MVDPLVILIELSEKKAADLANQMVLAQNRLQGSIEKLKTLQSYRDDYAKRYNDFATNETRGRLTKELENFMSFLAKLDEAIQMAEKDSHQLTLAVHQARAAWHDEQKKTKAYQTLVARKAHKTRMQQDKLLQKHQDEFAMRKYFESQHSSND